MPSFKQPGALPVQNGYHSCCGTDGADVGFDVGMASAAFCCGELGGVGEGGADIINGGT